MKKVVSLTLALIMIVAVFCGCSQEYTVKVSKDGSCKIKVVSAIPVETIEEMKALSEMPSDDILSEDSFDDLYTEEIPELDIDTDAVPELDIDTETIPELDMNELPEFDLDEEDLDMDLDMGASPSISEDDFSEIEKLPIKKVNGKDCYIEEINKKFSSTKKANKFMLEGTDEVGSYFTKFNLTTKDLSATIMDGMKESALIYGEDFTVKLKITMPYLITKTNGTLSENKKTVTFDLMKGGKIYAYTEKSSKSAKIYFKKDYLKSNSSAYLSWNKVKGAKKYKIEYKASDAKKWNSATTTKTAKTIKGLKAGKKYSFKVTAVTKSDKFTSQKTSITTLKKVAVKVKSKTDKSIKLSWKKDKTADGYIVYKKNSKKADWKKLTTIKKDSTVTYNVKGLKTEKKYYFKVVSYKKANGKTIKSTYSTLTAKTY